MSRAIATLQGQGARIDGAPGLGYVLRPGFTLPPLMFRPEEVEALVLGARWVAEKTDDKLAEAARNALARIAAVLPLWASHDVQPKPKASGGGGELAIVAKDDAEVDGKHGEWKERGWRIAQEPERMDFGYTFTALDPDGHRVRVMSLA